MIQNALVALLFLSALIYTGRLIYRSFTSKSNCDTGCAKCNTIDFNKIENQLKNKGI